MSTHLASLRRSRLRAARATAVAAASLGLASWALAAPVNITYFKDAQASSTSPQGSASPDILFSTPAAGLNQTSYTQASETVSATESQLPGSSGATTTYEANIDPGKLRAKSTSSTSGSYGGPIGTGLSTSADQILGIRDTLQVSGGTQGNTVSVDFGLMLDSLLSALNVPTSNQALCGYGSVSLWADVGSTRVGSLTRNLCAGSDAMTALGSFNAVSGQDFDLTLGMEILTQSAIGAGNVNGSSVSIDASHTGLLYLVLPNGFALTSTSGYGYLDPNGGNHGDVSLPGTLALAALGLVAVLPRRVRRR